MIIHWTAVEQYFTVVLFVFQFSQFVILDLALSGVKGLKAFRFTVFTRRINLGKSCI